MDEDEVALSPFEKIVLVTEDGVQELEGVVTYEDFPGGRLWTFSPISGSLEVPEGSDGYLQIALSDEFEYDGEDIECDCPECRCDEDDLP